MAATNGVSDIQKQIERADGEKPRLCRIDVDISGDTTAGDWDCNIFSSMTKELSHEPRTIQIFIKAGTAKHDVLDGMSEAIEFLKLGPPSPGRRWSMQSGDL